MSPGVAELSPSPYVALHPDDAARIGVAEGDLLELAGDSLTDRLPVKIRSDPCRRHGGCAGWVKQGVCDIASWLVCIAKGGCIVNDILQNLTIVVGVLLVVLTIAGGLIWLERRLLAFFQDRLGPNRAGPFGLLQVVADMIKIFTKEDWIPPFADKAVFVLAPGILVATTLMSFAMIAWAPRIVVANLNVGPAVRAGDVLVRRLQRGVGWLVIEQQVLAARWPASSRADARL